MIKLGITGSVPQDYFGDHVNPILWCKAEISCRKYILAYIQSRFYKFWAVQQQTKKSKKDEKQHLQQSTNKAE
jgi:hypothetical protein